VALPFSDVCSPFGEPAAMEELEVALDAVRTRLGVRLQVHGPLRTCGSPGPAYHHHVVALEPQVEDVRQRFTRRQAMQGVRRAQREGVTIERRTDVPALAAFYRLHTATRSRQGMPTQPRRFILRFASLFEAGLGFVSLAKLDGRTVSAAVFLSFNGVLTYKYGASDVRFLDRRPNNLLFMDAIRWGCEHGMHSFDMGRTDLGHESLRAFKLMWGAQEGVLRYTDLPEQASPGRPAGAPAAMQRLIRHAPPFVSRALGEVLYRHAG
jgi:lipid II:glycine glycyltransferase (peptidoglycan interpeptide bridge formation enzyme)